MKILDKKKILGVFIALSPLMFVACVDDEDDIPETLEANVDSYVQTKVIDGEVRYAVSHYVIANQTLSSAVVTTPGYATETIDLSPDTDLSATSVFAYEPTTEEYSTEAINSGSYYYDLVSTYEEVESVTISDILEENKLSEIVIDATTFDSYELNIQWTGTENAQEYYIRLYEANGALVYVSPALTSGTEDFTFSSESDGWASGYYPSIGAEYQIEVVGVLYETGSTDDNKAYNIQALTMVSSGVTWTE
ncbi:hypothetical protein EYV94_01115 [Puteibacter caeruleilacunae]|nr:hypothetical protein EYV94_01115 [Puteibacter caeruleilacunae]